MPVMTVGTGRSMLASRVASDPDGDALRSSLTAYWKLDGTTADSKGSFTLTAVNAPSTGTGRLNATSYDLVGADSERFTRADNAALRLVAGVSTSFDGYAKKTNAATNGDILGKYGGGSNEFSFGHYAAQGWIYAGTAFPQATTALPNTIANNAWYHWAITYNHTDTVLKIYINGAEVGSSTVTLNAGGASNLSIGGIDAGATYFTGMIEHVGVYNGTVLTPAQVLYRYSSGNGKALYP